MKIIFTILPLIIFSLSSFAQKNFIKVDTSINYEKVILYACGEEIEVLKGDTSFELSECDIVESIKVFGLDSIIIKEKISIKRNKDSTSFSFYKKRDESTYEILKTNEYIYTFEFKRNKNIIFKIENGVKIYYVDGVRIFNNTLNLPCNKKESFSIPLTGIPAQYENQQK